MALRVVPTTNKTNKLLPDHKQQHTQSLGATPLVSAEAQKSCRWLLTPGAFHTGGCSADRAPNRLCGSRTCTAAPTQRVGTRTEPGHLLPSLRGLSVKLQPTSALRTSVSQAAFPQLSPTALCGCAGRDGPSSQLTLEISSSQKPWSTKVQRKGASRRPRRALLGF